MRSHEEPRESREPWRGLIEGLAGGQVCEGRRGERASLGARSGTVWWKGGGWAVDGLGLGFDDFVVLLACLSVCCFPVSFCLLVSCLVFVLSHVASLLSVV